MSVSKAPQIDIAYLADVPHFIPLLTKWFVKEWYPYYGPNGPGDVRRDLLESCQTDQLPVGLVAINNDGDLVGTIALKTDSVGSESAKGPWLAAFLVKASNRRNGIGSMLVGAVESEALHRGYSELFTSTDKARSLLEGCGWATWGVTQSLRGPIAIYHKTMSQPANLKQKRRH